MELQRGTGPKITIKLLIFTLVVLPNLPRSLTQHADDHYVVEPTPTLRLSDEDLTTVLLVNNDNRSEAHGRFLNVRPTVGLLTSTARTFIQEGVTTEYATQVLGTTLENGRLYAQLLKKSSRVLYDKDNIETSLSSGGAVHTSIVGETLNSHVFNNPKVLLQSHNDLVPDNDWQDVDDSLVLEKNPFVVNTDYIATVPKVSNAVYPLRISYLNEKGIDYEENTGVHSKSLLLNRSALTVEAFKIKANKVRPKTDLPTFTVKNMFSPSGFSWESPIENTEHQQDPENVKPINTFEPRSPKLLYHKIMKEERRPLSTVTYYGFAEFTTVVGDSVIVFSPSTSTDKFPVGQITSIKGEATLGHQDASYISNIAITITQDLIEPTFVLPMLSTNINDLQIMPKDMRDDSRETSTLVDISDRITPSIIQENNTHIPSIEPTIINDFYETTFASINAVETMDGIQVDETLASDEETTIKSEIPDEEFIPTTTELIDIEDIDVSTESEKDDYNVNLTSSMSDNLSPASVKESTSSETQTRVMLSRPSDEEILQIFSSLASAEAAEKASKMQNQNLNSIDTTVKSMNEFAKIHETIMTDLREQIQPETKVEGGATTIFFEDDPFLDFVSPNTVSLETSQSSVYISKSHQTNIKEGNKVNEDNIQSTESVMNSGVAGVDVGNLTTTLDNVEENDKNELNDVQNMTFSNSTQNIIPIIMEISENDEIEGCIRTSQVFLTQIPKTFTYYTTYLLSKEGENDIKSSSIETNIVPSFDISQATKHYCIQPTQTLSTEFKIEESVLERPAKKSKVEAETVEDIVHKDIEDTYDEVVDTTTPYIENKETDKISEIDSSDMNYEDDEEDEEEEDETDHESGEEIELIFKTLYTTYTYLTTFFHDSTTSVSSHKEVVTNIITSSLDAESSTSIDQLNIKPTASILESDGAASTIISKVYDSLSKSFVQSSDLIEIDGILRRESDEIKPSTHLNNDNILKTYYTTYTYYTTIFVDGETEVMSRTEVHTNVVGTPSDISPSPRNLNFEETIFEEDNDVIKIKPTTTNGAIIKTPIFSYEIQNNSAIGSSNDLKHKTFSHGLKELESSSSSYSSRTEKKIIQLEDFLRGKADVQSSRSNGDYQMYENGGFEDQVSSESNREEIIPSATLLLQTSFTTYTYYTTMYSSDTSNIVSRLETITNIVTETLQPTKTFNIDEATLPVTYFTTFTYWTKLAKDGEITTLSREETVSNIVTPSLSESNKNTIEPTTTLEQLPSSAEAEDISKFDDTVQTEDLVSQSLVPTTYYTTYTYYTTSYAGDQTITDSRFETVTNIVSPTKISSSEILDNTTPTINTELVVDTSPTKGSKTISYDFKTIVDADEVSTLYKTTVVFATEVDGSSKEITSSTSSINIDEVKKANLSKSATIANESSRSYKTGLVRLIEGTEFLNHTTTVYQSKIIGTIIDDRYAQIIESTSSFIIEKTLAPPLRSVSEIIASPTILPTSVQSTELVANTVVKPLESSITDPIEENEQSQEFEEEDDIDENGEDDDGDRKRTRLSFQTRKRTFTPVIRPFASRNRPQFAPKRKNILQSSATIITRSDFTPTITATPAIKSDSRGRFSSTRKSNNAFTNISGSSSTGGKRFGRPSKPSQLGSFATSLSFSNSRNRLQSSRTLGFSSGFGIPSSRRSGVPFRSPVTNSRLFSSSYGGNSRLKIRPSSSLPFDSASNTGIYTTLPPDSEDEGLTQKYDDETDVTTENLRRSNNPLLRFRRPQVSRPPFQAGQRNVPVNQLPTRRPPQQKAKITASNNLTTTVRPKSRTFQRPTIVQIQNRSRPQSSLFPPRRLFQAQNINQEEEQKIIDDFEDNENEENNSAEYENDADVDDNDARDSSRRRRESVLKQISKKRSKRQADSNTRSNFRNRFRRPTTSKPVAADRFEEYTEEEPSTVRSRTTSRFTPRSHSLSTSTHSSSKPQSNSRAIRPTKPNSNNRAQFTLREKDTTPKLPSRPSNFRRPTPNGISSRRATTVASRPKQPRLKSYGNTVTESSHSSPRGRSSTSRTRATTRGRNRNDITTDAIIPVFDGTITVTHVSPTEITIPVVNGKVTEYKNILTTTSSTEVLIPNQYTTLIGQNGASTLVLNREETSVNANGATEITQFVLQESLTSTVIFTPTTIRGRKTSFAHVIPSTVYQVENVISTIQANIAASAPLANILLSQLLLGNIGLNQPNINPLLALGGTQAISQPAATPVTEYKTRSSTYVTTVTNGMSTVIPLTFHGKEILTTIYDSTSNVITATEYFTDTVVVTPTQQAAQQVNSLLLPLLLQQQLQGQSQIHPSLPMPHSIPSQLLFSDNLQDLDSNGIQKYTDESQDIEEYSNSQGDQLISQDGSKSNGRKNGRRYNKHQASPTSAFESSVITLYVSGRRPGEFSTVLSTIQLGSDSSLYKRHINRAYSQPVLKSESVDLEDFYRSDGSEIQEYLLPATNDITTSQDLAHNFSSEKTQSLESIVGDVGLWYAETSAQLENPTSHSTIFAELKSTSTKTKMDSSLGKPDINTNRHHLQQNIHIQNAMYTSQHETRSIHVSSISNTKSSDNGNVIQLNPYDVSLTMNSNQYNDGISDAASPGVDEARYNLATRVMSNGVEVIIAGDKTGKGSHKSSALRILPSLSHKPMTLAPSTLKDQMILLMPSDAQKNYTISINSNNFITKTCLTTYTYRTTYLQDGITTVESREKVVSNTATEERNYFKISPTGSLGVTLSRTPELAVGIFHTTYTYYNTILDGDLPIVLSSQHILTNTITGPDDYISFLQPSEEATPVHETNTYFSSISLTKTLKESNIEKIVSTSNLLTQVVITESLPPRSSSIITSYNAFDTNETGIHEKIADEAENDPNHTIQKISPANDSVIVKSPYLNSDIGIASKLHGAFKSDIHIYATKTYLTTFTYLTTLINTQVGATPSTRVNFHTRVIENVITESIPIALINGELLSKFESNLQSKNRESYVTKMTLPTGQSIEVTAVNILHSTSTEKAVNDSIVLIPKPSVSSSYDASIFSALPDLEENNEMLDSETGSSENNDQYIPNSNPTNTQKNNTKVSELNGFPSVNQIIETFNLNRLQALGPVFNAMAGLIQNNFGGPTSTSNTKRNHTAVNVESKHSIKNISAYDTSPMYEGPIYIPVQNLHNTNRPENIDDLKVSGEIAQHLILKPPRTDWFGDENQNHIKVEPNPRKPTYETPLLNGGIPISPGEVITANSDVIVGKPNGIQPRIPFAESNLDIGNALLPPPPPKLHLPLSSNTYTHLKQTKAIPRPIPLDTSYGKETNFDGILKPPPLIPPYLHQIPKIPHNILNHNYRINYAEEQYMHQAQQQHYLLQYQPQSQISPIVQQHLRTQSSNKEITQKTSLSNKRIVPQKHNYIPYRPHDYDSQLNFNKKSETDLNKELYNNEILEIRKIPEVYSTDLPGKESAVLDNNITNFKTQIKKVIGSNKPMLVDIKPSQITNIVIPRDNTTSILIVESDVETHKNGQYYDEPTLYTDDTVTDSRKYLSTLHKPILSNQQINLDTNVLSHNIDINVPPITFNKDTEFPHSTPVRGQISRKETSNFQMPHITIPITDNQIQVNLTPHNTLKQKIIGSTFNNMDSANKERKNYISQSFQNTAPIRYIPSSPSTSIRIYNEHKLNVSSKNSIPRPISRFNSTQPHTENTTALNANLNLNKESEMFSKENVLNRVTFYNRIYPNRTTITPTKLRPTFNPAPLLHLFYGLRTDAQEKGEITETHQPTEIKHFWDKDENGDDEDDINVTEDSNKMEDQKVSSSVNIAVPLQNKVKKAELMIAELDKYRIQHSNLNILNQNYSVQKSNATFNIETSKNSQQVGKISNRQPLFGSESYLDSSSVKALNNLKELDIHRTSSTSPPSPPNATFSSPNKGVMSIGKPFSKTKTPNLNQSQSTKNIHNFLISTGEGFKLHTEDKSQKKLVPLDTKQLENREELSTINQTENPLKLKINKNIKKPSKPLSSTATAFQPSPTTTITGPQQILNKLELQNQVQKNYTQHRTRDSSEIFDSYESVNPHNHNYVNFTSNESTKMNTMHQKHENRGSSTFMAALDIKSPIIPLKPEPENIKGLIPPLTRPTLMIRPSASSSVHFPLTISTRIDTKGLNAAHRNHKLQLSSKHSYATNQTVETSTSISTKTGPISHTRPTLRLKQKTSENSFIKTSHTSKIYATPLSLKIKTTSTIGYVTPIIEKIPSGILISSELSPSFVLNRHKTSSNEKTSKSELVISASPTLLETTVAEKKTVVTNNNAHEHQVLTLNQEIPGEILTERSEASNRRKPSVTRYENHTIIYQERPFISETRLSISKPSVILKNTKTSVVTPIKSVTNTGALTITTTKTSVVTSLSTPPTQTLTLTKTHISTLIDTVTKTHTLLRPTNVKEVLDMTPTKTIRQEELEYEDFQSSEDIGLLDNNDNNYDRDQQDIPPKITSINPITTPNTNLDDENNSIFVVMTDKKNNGDSFSIIPSMIDTPHNINAIGSENGLDYDENITLNLPTRDEDFGINEVNHVLLGGVLIATPPKANDNSHLNLECRPSCKASRNEICQLIDNTMTCICRPGFARMFPDRPCRPTYTYAMQVPIHRISKQALHFKEQYRMKDSDEFKQLAGITHDAVDRMIMQSDLRDVYHGVHVTSFDEMSESENGVLGKFLIQLSDNSDESRLVDVLKKYLRQHNFSLGGTEIFTTKNGVNSLEITDFDECSHTQFHDCSENSRCFNLQGTYTCSCQEGYIDLSENAIYPGRICSAEIVGCEKCHYHGKCIQEDKSAHPICECFHWYTGALCQVNLKVLLLALVTVGMILFIMLLICVLLTCAKKKKHHKMQTLMSSINILAPRNSRLSGKHQKPDKRAMIKDSGSETSQNSLPSTLKDTKKKKFLSAEDNLAQQQTVHHKNAFYRNINQRGQPSLTLVSTLSEIDRRHEFIEQADRSLTVMIPRAKYHHSFPPQGNTEDKISATPKNEPQLHETETANCQCSLEKRPKPSSKKKLSNIANHGALHTSSTGALVSAGFEVSATVGNTRSEKNSPAEASSALENSCNELFKINEESHMHSKIYQDQYLPYNCYKNEEKFIDSMDVWLDTIQQNELTAEARSFDETTIQAPTKSLRSVYDRQLGQSNTNDEANTMAERDIGSTFLLPHTHLYKPDRDSEISGFDSI